MFSTGQLIFAGLFLVCFVFVIIKAYGKDKSLHKKNYKGIQWIIAYFAIFVLFLFLVKYLMKN